MRQILTNIFSNEKEYIPKYQYMMDAFKPRLTYTNEMELELQKIRYYPVYNQKCPFKITRV